MNLVGQKTLKQKIASVTLLTLPKTIMFVGAPGCGKHSFAAEIAKKLKLDLVELDEKITSDQLIEFNQKVIKTLYVIDLTKFTEKQQNQFLKFIEEPSASVYIILITNSENGVLPTILNRCLKYYFEPYSKEDLIKLNLEYNKEPKTELYYSICNTPGTLKKYTLADIQKLYNFCVLLVKSIAAASWPNTLKISTMINYKEDYNKFDFNLFFDVLRKVAFDSYYENNIPHSFIIFKEVTAAKQKMLNKQILKENFMINFLLTLWEAVKNDNSRA